MQNPQTVTCDVAIVGGGPAGLTLAIELGRRGIDCLLLDDKPGTTRNPQANATQARTMEHFRRLGFAHEIRAMGLPADYPTDAVFYTRFAHHELARFRMPAAAAVAQMARASAGSWSTPELPHRCSQLFLEPVLRKHAEANPGVRIRFNWRVTSLASEAEGVTLQAEHTDGRQRCTVRARYAVGCDGPRSLVRRTLGIGMEGESRVVRDWMGGKMHATYFRSRELYRLIPGDKAWMYLSFNQDRRSFMAAIDGTEEFVFHSQFRPGEDDENVSPAQAHAMFCQALGTECPIEPISSTSWHAGHALVAQRYGDSRVFIAGDAAHLFTPTGGLGYNTAIEDVANLGWKLAAVLQGWAPAALLATYDLERQPLGVRNTSRARAFAHAIGNFLPDPNLEASGPAGEAARRAAGAFLGEHLEREFNIPGITFGGRYDGSPIIVADGTAPPPDEVNRYVPTACPGGRAPHAWLADGRSLFDGLGPDFTVLVMKPDAADAHGVARHAQASGVPVSVLHLDSEELREAYGADLGLIRPDQHVAWRGDSAQALAGAIPRAIGF